MGALCFSGPLDNNETAEITAIFLRRRPQLRQRLFFYRTRTRAVVVTTTTIGSPPSCRVSADGA